MMTSYYYKRLFAMAFVLWLSQDIVLVQAQLFGGLLPLVQRVPSSNTPELNLNFLLPTTTTAPPPIITAQDAQRAPAPNMPQLSLGVIFPFLPTTTPEPDRSPVRIPATAPTLMQSAVSTPLPSPTTWNTDTSNSSGNEPFQCEDQETTIDGELFCNGIKDCPDGSDEKPVCRFITCPSDFVRCDYGACVRDRSVCGTTNQKITADGCQITSIPENGYIALAASPTKHLDLNTFVVNYGAIQYGCQANYHLIGANPTALCINGEWSGQSKMPTCEPRCNMTEIASITYMTNCFRIVNNRNEEVPCAADSLIEPGVIVRISCKTGYKSTLDSNQQTTCDRYGRWTEYPRACKQVCGNTASSVGGFIVAGSIAENRQVPWHVGIYRFDEGTRNDEEAKYICGGTIINARLVISAMHCFWDGKQAAPASNYRVVAGKFYRQLTDRRERNHYQVLDVRRIEHVEGYNDYDGLYADDIALLILDNFIEFKPNVAPACINLHYDYEEKVIPPGALGFVAGWGHTQDNGQPSDELKSLEIPVVNRTECLSTLDEPTKPFLTSKKFCAGIVDAKAGVCVGDSGGGLMFLENIGNRMAYHLRGIVSSGTKSGLTCSSNRYAFFTNVAHFWELILKFDLETNPSHGSNGKD